MILKQRGNIIAVLDIGSSKIVCLIAKVSNYGKFEVIGIGHNVSYGVRAGIITDIRAVESSITQAVEAAETAAGEKIKKIYASIASNSLLSQRVFSEISVTGREINYKDLNRLLFGALERYQQQSIEILHTFVYNYILDGNHGITSPLGLHGDKLACNLHMISTPTNNLLNFSSCITKCSLEVQGYISGAYATGMACLTEDEMQLGVTLIEFGAGSTSITIFENNYVIYTDGVPLGGVNVTNDIAKGLCISLADAERVKNLYGAVIMTDSDIKDVFELKAVDEEVECDSVLISRHLLIEIIRARIDEILELVVHKLEANNIKIYGKVVIAGSGARISGLRELTAHLFSSKVRIGYSKSIEGIDGVNTLEFGAAIGMLMHVVDNMQERKNMYGNGSKFNNVLKWLKDYFQN
ncbi:Cell division protein FtsA [Alphaproteobacteria bacterium]